MRERFLVFSVAEVKFAPLDHAPSEALAVRLRVRRVVSVAHVNHSTVIVQRAEDAIRILPSHDHEVCSQLPTIVVPGPSLFCKDCHLSHPTCTSSGSFYPQLYATRVNAGKAFTFYSVVG